MRMVGCHYTWLHLFCCRSTDEHGWLPLHVASNAGREDVVQWLCVNVIDLDALTSTGYTAMHLAAMQGHKPCMVVSKLQAGVWVGGLCRCL